MSELNMLEKIIKFIFFKDIKEERNKNKQELNEYHPAGDKALSSKGLRMLVSNIIDLNFSTSKYSRILIFLTIVIAVLTILMFLKG